MVVPLISPRGFFRRVTEFLGEIFPRIFSPESGSGKFLTAKDIIEEPIMESFNPLILNLTNHNLLEHGIDKQRNKFPGKKFCGILIGPGLPDFLLNTSVIEVL